MSSLVTNVSPGSLPNSSSQVASIVSEKYATGATVVVSADINVAGSVGSNIFMQIVEANSSTLIASSQIQLAGSGTTFATMRCIGFLFISSMRSVVWTLNCWTDGTASIGTGSGVFEAHLANPQLLA